jgi:hypothetical protein
LFHFPGAVLLLWFIVDKFNYSMLWPLWIYSGVIPLLLEIVTVIQMVFFNLLKAKYVKQKPGRQYKFSEEQIEMLKFRKYQKKKKELEKLQMEDTYKNQMGNSRDDHNDRDLSLSGPSYRGNESRHSEPRNMGNNFDDSLDKPRNNDSFDHHSSNRPGESRHHDSIDHHSSNRGPGSRHNDSYNQPRPNDSHLNSHHDDSNLHPRPNDSHHDSKPHSKHNDSINQPSHHSGAHSSHMAPEPARPN